MIVNCVQKGSSILIYKDRGSTDMNPGYLVAFNGSSYSYVCSPGSQTLIVRDERRKHIATVQMQKRVWEGIGWKKK